MTDVTGPSKMQGHLLSLRGDACASDNAFDALDKHEGWHLARHLKLNT